jgi:hypothetical protein
MASLSAPDGLPHQAAREALQAEKKAREAEKKRLKALERKERQALETALVKGGAAVGGAPAGAAAAAAAGAEAAAAAARSQVEPRRGEHVHAERSEGVLAKPSATVTPDAKPSAAVTPDAKPSAVVTPDAESLDTALEAVLRAAEVDVMYEEMAKEMALKREAEEYADWSAPECL